MNMRGKRNLFGLVLVLLLSVVAVGQVLKGFRYPDYDEKGQLKFEITGDEAQIQPDGLIKIKNLKMAFYEQGKVMMQVSTPQCLFDRVKRSAVSSSDVCVARKEIELTGRGFAWNAQDGRMQIFSNTRVVLRNLRWSAVAVEPARNAAHPSATLARSDYGQGGVADGPAKPAQAGEDTNSTVITSTQLIFDQQKRNVVFTENVLVTDREIKILSDRLEVFFTQGNEVDRVEAEGRVTIVRNDLKATGEKAAYDIQAGKLLLTGNPCIQWNQDTLTGETVTLWRNSKRILCEPNARLLIASEQEMNRSFKE